MGRAHPNENLRPACIPFMLGNAPMGSSNPILYFEQIKNRCSPVAGVMKRPHFTGPVWTRAMPVSEPPLLERRIINQDIP